MVHARALFRDPGPEAHGDIIVWPLKALCDYIEATGDFAFLDEPVAWRREDNFETTHAPIPSPPMSPSWSRRCANDFIPGTHLLRYGNGDWNDSLQPVDPALRDWMASSWTSRCSISNCAATRRSCARPGARQPAKRTRRARRGDARRTSHRFLRPRRRGRRLCGVPAARAGRPNCFSTPATGRPGLSFSLIPMTQAIIGGLLHARRRRAATWRSSRNISSSRRRAADGPAARLSRRPGDDLPTRRNRPPSSAAKSG